MEVEVGEEAVIGIRPCLVWLVNLHWIQLRFDKESWETTRRPEALCLARCLHYRRLVMRSIIRIALHPAAASLPLPHMSVT